MSRRLGVRARRLPPAALAVVAVVALAGCADREPTAPAPPAPASTSAASAASASPTASGKASTGAAGKPGASSSTTTALPGMPVPSSVGASAVDSTRLRSTDDLASAFGCATAVPPIRLTATPAPTGATAPPAPDAVVCASSLADGEALFLWYTPTPEAKLGALTAALDRARYVHGGPNWVAAGTINPQMGRVGGEVYR